MRKFLKNLKSFKTTGSPFSLNTNDTFSLIAIDVYYGYVRTHGSFEQY
jgi:hypothetical protein